MPLMVIAQNSPVEAWTSGWADILAGSVLLAIMMGIILWSYRSMQRPRLHLGYRQRDDRPIVTWQAVLRYLVTTPLSLVVWLLALMLILTLVAKGRSAEDIALAAACVIGAVRLLAHISRDAAHELGKTLPLAVLSLVLIGGSVAGTSVESIFTEFEENAAVIDSYYFYLLVFDVVLTTIWTLRQYGKWDTSQTGTLRNRTRASFRRLTRPLHVIRDFGKQVNSTHD